VRIINNVASQLPQTASGEELSRLLLEEVMDMDTEPCHTAINFVKAEIARLMT
jgi:hypothetical protein